jgi:type I restriction enzyme S subunit
VNATTLKSLTIPLPPLLEQRRIAAILDKADELRTKRRTALEHLNRLTRSMFLEKFGDPLPRNSRWRVVSLSEACEKISDGTHHSPLTLKEGIPYVTAKHIREDGIDFDSAPWFISEADHRAIFSRCDPRPDDVLYIKDGATTGIAAVNRLSYQFSMLSSVALLRPRSGVMKADYLWAWLNDPVVRAGILGNMAGAAIRRLTLVKIKRLLIPVPPITQQDDFARRLKVVAMLTACERRSLTEADRLFGSLQYRAFSGALR